MTNARDEGLNVFAETCPQYLFLDLDDLGNGFEGAKFVCSPPLRDRAEGHQEALWSGLATNDLQVVSTDHCPFCFEDHPELGRQKRLGEGDFSKIPNGLPGVEHRVELIYHGAVNEERLSLERWVEVCSTTPARMFGLFPRKGTIAVGADADIVDLRSQAQARSVGRDPPHEDRLLLLRRHATGGRSRHRPVPGPGDHQPATSTTAKRATAST